VPTARLAVVAGEALTDLVPAPGDALAAHPGRGPFNTARTLGRLERPVAYLGRLSTDRFGQRMRRCWPPTGCCPTPSCAPTSAAADRHRRTRVSKFIPG